MTDFVYILEVEFKTALMTKTVRMSFVDRDEAEKFRNAGLGKSYKVIHLTAYTAYTAEKGWKMIDQERADHRKIEAQVLDAQRNQ